MPFSPYVIAVQPSSPNDDRLTLSRSAHSVGSAPRAPEAASFLVFEQDTSYLVPVVVPSDVTIGRDHDATLRLADPEISRRHARVVATAGWYVITDLGSHNGTQVNGETLTEPRALVSGDVISVCSTQLVFHHQATPIVERAPLDLGTFRQRAEEECDRAIAAEQDVLLLSVGFSSSIANRRGELVQALGGLLRLGDALCFADAREALVLLPERSLTEAAAVAAAFRNVEPSARVGAAACPRDGREFEHLLGAARNATEAEPARTSLATPRDVAQTRHVGPHLIQLADPAMLRVYALVDRLAASALPVLIGGETGTGKELIATTLHAGSTRRDKPFRAVNCAALPEGLAESELFGHARGAFSGAATARAGLFESANGGTVFLDEIAELPTALQPKLLRVLETKRLVRLGESEERTIDVRVIAATHKDLALEVAAGRFRQDLLYRLGAARVTLPPLRERPREVTVLAESFLEQACHEAGRPMMAFSPSAVGTLRGYGWPGNIRELKNIVELLTVTVLERTILPFHLEPLLGHVVAAPTAPPAPLPRAPSPPAQFTPIDDEVRALEVMRMQQALEVAGGVKKTAAELIAMPLRTFNTKYKLYGLSRG